MAEKSHGSKESFGVITHLDLAPLVVRIPLKKAIKPSLIGITSLESLKLLALLPCYHNGKH